MGMYSVTWEIDIDADDPYSAAEEALRIQRDPESTAVVFEVRNSSEPDSFPVVIDLVPF